MKSCIFPVVALLAGTALLALGSISEAQASWRLSLPKRGVSIDIAGVSATQSAENVWQIAASANNIEGSVRAGRHAMTCRIAPGSRTDVVQTRFGRSGVNSRVNAIFNPDTDCVVLFSAGQLLPKADGGFSFSATDTKRVEVEIIPNYYKERLHVRFYAPIDKSVFHTAPSGWCTWYYYYKGIHESDMIANTDWMVHNLKPFGAEYIQLDDGWQGGGESNIDDRNFFITAVKHFPHGMAWLADQIHTRGMKAGIWVVPFGQSNDDIFKKDKSMWLRRADGTSVGIDANGNGCWVGKYILDSSNPKSQKYLTDMFHTFAHDWGYDYFKLDGQPDIPELYTKYHKQLFDQSVPKSDVEALGPQESRDTQSFYGTQSLADGAAYRLGLQAIRDAIGKERFLLGCGGTLLLNEVGIMNGARTGGDVNAGWGGVQVASDATRNGYFLHNIVWYSDPDVLCVRPPLTLDQARFWATLFGVTGQVLLASDNMPELTPDRVEVLKRVFPAADLTPVDLYRYPQNPNVWDTKINTDAGDWDVVTLLNYTDKPAESEVQLVDLGLDAGHYITYDFWNQRYLGEATGSIKANLAPQSCLVLAVHKAQDHPQVISTSRHILQGAIDLHKVRWSAAKLQLTGRSDLIGGDPYELRIALPKGYQFDSVSVTPNCNTTAANADGFTAVKLTSAQSGPVSWTVLFKK